MQQPFYLHYVSRKSWEKIFLIELCAVARGFTVVIKVFSGKHHASPQELWGITSVLRGWVSCRALVLRVERIRPGRVLYLRRLHVLDRDPSAFTLGKVAIRVQMIWGRTSFGVRPLPVLVAWRFSKKTAVIRCGSCTVLYGFNTLILGAGAWNHGHLACLPSF